MRVSVNGKEAGRYRSLYVFSLGGRPGDIRHKRGCGEYLDGAYRYGTGQVLLRLATGKS